MTTVDEQITVLVPTSPLPSHPDTYGIEELVSSIRCHLPTAKIILMCDGVRPSVEHRRQQYEGYKQRIRANCLDLWRNVEVLEFDQYTQQAKMTRVSLARVNTPFVMFMEHDTPLVNRRIEWSSIFDAIADGMFNLIRFLYMDKVHPEHEYLAKDLVACHGTKFLQTLQYSQWPHVAGTKYYLDMLNRHFSPDQIAMIEPVMYGFVVESPWNVYRVGIYYPDDGALCFVHRDGRAGDPKDW